MAARTVRMSAGPTKIHIYCKCSDDQQRSSATVYVSRFRATIFHWNEREGWRGDREMAINGFGNKFISGSRKSKRIQRKRTLRRLLMHSGRGDNERFWLELGWSFKASWGLESEDFRVCKNGRMFCLYNMLSISSPSYLQKPLGGPLRGGSIQSPFWTENNYLDL